MAVQSCSTTRKERVVVVGSGMVSHRFCDQFAKSNVCRERYQVTVLGQETVPAYDRTRLSATLGYDSKLPLLADTGWYAERDISLRLATRVVRVDAAARVVELASGEQLQYDKLVLATGASAAMPNVVGHDAPSVFVYRTSQDIARIRSAAAAGRTGIVVGGGLLGLEAARVLLDAGLAVHVVEASPTLLSRQLDARSGQLLNEQVRALGVTTHLAHRLQHIERLETHGRLRLHFQDAIALDGDVVVMATGIRPRDELARDAGLRCGERGGVVVSDALETSDPHIFAIGECAVHRGEHYGLVAPGYEMADVLVASLEGAARRFERGDTSCELKLLGIPVSVAGASEQHGTLLAFERGDQRRTLVVDGERLIGASCIGAWPQFARVRDMCKRRARIYAAQLKQFAENGELWADGVEQRVSRWPAETVVCNCTGVARGQLSACMSAGFVSIDCLTRRTGAGSVCGGCKPLLGQLTGTTTMADTHGRMAVLVASSVALLTAFAIVILGRMLVIHSVQQLLHRAAELWRDPSSKQITGYTLLTLSVLSMVMSARKRLSWFRFGHFGSYRALHTALSCTALALTILHTGMQLGANLNLVLMLTFISVALLGSLAGVATALETGGTGLWAKRARRLRPALSQLHIVLLWPLPVLVGLHIFSAYYF
jgi:nitrite reductase (NADH) large subunit